MAHLPQSSKEKSARVDWGYHNRSAPTTRTRRRLWFLAFVLIATPAIAATVAAGLNEEIRAPLAITASRGELASVHSAWDSKCEACHEPFAPIHGDSWITRALGMTSAHSGAAANSRCESCHTGSAHHPMVPESEAMGCAVCHQDHRGRDANLVSLADATCTRCHADLKNHHVAPDKLGVADGITSFVKGHPEFQDVALAKQTRRSMKFSHAVHMAPGLGVGSGSRYVDIPDEKARTRYMQLAGETDPNAVVKLDCSACHQLDASRVEPGQPLADAKEKFTASVWRSLSGQPREAILPPRAAGQYYLPIEFEAHCQACHPLNFDEAPGLRNRAVPHRVQPDQIDQYLREVYAARYLADTLDKPTLPLNRADARLDNRPRDLDASAKQAARQQIDKQVDRAKSELLLGRKACQECHYTETLPGEKFPAVIRGGTLPTIWQTQAKFDHSAHRAMTCNACHPASYRTIPEERAAALHNDPHQHAPDLPGIDSCRQCHAPASGRGVNATGGVRHGCTDCHTYHHADRRLQGTGSPLGVPTARGSAEAVLRGTPGQSPP